MPDGSNLVTKRRVRGTFELSHAQDGFVKTPAWLVGPFAIHRDRPASEWTISHAATGKFIPYVYPTTLDEAERICAALEPVIDWSKIKRGRAFPEVTGWTKARKLAVRAALRKLDLLPERV